MKRILLLRIDVAQEHYYFTIVYRVAKLEEDEEDFAVED
jgi:hypothetical protein